MPTKLPFAIFSDCWALFALVYEAGSQLARPLATGAGQTR